jgi:hypothetical protein
VVHVLVADMSLTLHESPEIDLSVHHSCSRGSDEEPNSPEG